MGKVVIRRFEAADDARRFTKGRFEVVRVGGMTLGRAIYKPGWKWSEHVGAASASSSRDGPACAWTMEMRSRCDPGTFSPFLRGTTAGSSVMSRTCRCT